MTLKDKIILFVADVILQALNEQTEHWKWHGTSVKKGYWEHLLLGHTQTAVVTVVSLS